MGQLNNTPAPRQAESAIVSNVEENMDLLRPRAEKFDLAGPASSGIRQKARDIVHRAATFISDPEGINMSEREINRRHGAVTSESPHWPHVDREQLSLRNRRQGAVTIESPHWPYGMPHIS